MRSLFVCLSLLNVVLLFTRQANGNDLPNIVFFITDDYGWQDSSEPFWTERSEFNDRYRTPNMERLAAQGVKFTNAYTACSVCSASRISIITGQHPVRHGTTFIVGTPGRNTRTMQSAEQDNDGVQEQDVLLPNLLKQAGYQTICIGKAHFGRQGTFGADPLNLGFDRTHYSNHSGSPVGKAFGGRDAYHVDRDGEQVHLSEALTLEAKAEISSAVEDDKPFFLYLSHYAVHTPIFEDPRFSANYPELNGKSRAYATLVEGADKSLGDVMDHIARLGIAKDTLIIWTADNGGLTNRGTNDSPYGDPLQTLNWPLRYGKNDAYEGGHRVPSIIAWGAHDAESAVQQRIPLPPGSTETHPFIHYDWMPTLLNLTGISHPTPQLLDGEDLLLSLLDDNPLTERTPRFMWHEPNFWMHSGPESSIRDDRWKLIYFYVDRHWELYDLDQDIGERTNLIDEHPEIATPLAAGLISWLDTHGAHYPVDLVSGEETPPTAPQ
jgi:arylsulfatase A-like enzyme